MTHSRWSSMHTPDCIIFPMYNIDSTVDINSSPSVLYGRRITRLSGATPEATTSAGLDSATRLPKETNAAYSGSLSRAWKGLSRPCLWDAEPRDTCDYVQASVRERRSRQGGQGGDTKYNRCRSTRRKHEVGGLSGGVVYARPEMIIHRDERARQESAGRRRGL